MTEQKIYPKYIKLLTVLVFTFVIVVLPKIVFAATANLSPNTVTVGLNNTFVVNLDVSSVTNLYGVSCYIYFDPSLVKYVSFSEGGFLLNGSTPTSILISNAVPGRISFSAVRDGTVTGVSGSGTIAKLTFASLDNYGNTNLTFSSSYLQDSNLNFISTTWTGASVSIPAPADTSAPTVPTGLSASVISTSQINLSWDVSTDNVAVTGYRIYRNNTLLTTVTNTNYQNTGLDAGTAYSYQVSAIDAASNESARTSAVSATTQQAPDTSAPTVPTGLSASAVSASQINLSWNASTDNTAVTGYRIYRNNTLLTTVTNTNYQNTGLDAGTAYSYQVSAIDAASNESVRTSAVSATTQPVSDTTAPSTPTNVSVVSVTASQINLSWTASTDDRNVTGYKVYRDNIYMMTVTGTTYYNAGLLENTTYAYQFSAVDAAGNESARTSAVSATTQQAPDTSVPTVPSGLSASAVSASQINLSWNASTDDRGVTGYKVYRNNAFVITVTDASFQNTGLSPAASYSYQVSAIDAAGNESAKSSSVKSTTLQASDASAPSAPSNLKVRYDLYRYPQDVRLYWTRSRDNKSGTIVYRVYRNNELIATTTKINFYNKLESYGSYAYYIKAVDAAGNESSASNEVIINYTPDTTAPTASSNLSSRYNLYYHPKDVRLRWNRSKDERPGKLVYAVYRNEVRIATTSGASFYNKLDDYGTYVYNIKALDVAGNEAVGSNPATIVYSPDTTAPAAPNSLRSKYNLYYSPKNVHLYWKRSKDERPGRVVYAIYRNDVKIATTSGLSYLNKLDDYGTYVYDIKALDVAGNESIGSNSITIVYAPDTTAPKTPTGFNSYQSKSNRSSIKIYWKSVRDERPGVVMYNVYRNGEMISTVKGLSFSEKLSTQGSYEYQVSAVDVAGNESAKTSSVTVVW